MGLIGVCAALRGGADGSVSSSVGLIGVCAALRGGADRSVCSS